jgi:hypothetical protein
MKQQMLALRLAVTKHLKVMTAKLSLFGEN